MRNYINTVSDMVNQSMPSLLWNSYGFGAPNFSGLGIEIRKDAPVLTSTEGAWDATYGAMCWSQVNLEANAFGSLPKNPHRTSGWRVITAASATANGGISESAALPATVKPTFAKLYAKPKLVANNFDMSTLQELMAKTPTEDAAPGMDVLRAQEAMTHKNLLNRMLLVDVSARLAIAAAHRDITGDATYWYDMETLDRIVSSDSEEDAFGSSYNNWFDPYLQDATIDRDSGTTYDSYVSHASGTDRAISHALMHTVFQNIEDNAGNTTFLLTGHDTYHNIIQLYDNATGTMQYNVLGVAPITVGVNGVQAESGIPVTPGVATLYGKPIITSANVPKDGSSRVFFLDTSDPEGFGLPRLGIDVAMPTAYFESGISKGDPFGLNRVGDEGMFLTVGEVRCRNFKAQGKLRDLS